jgi:N-methylhydantoinase A
MLRIGIDVGGTFTDVFVVDDERGTVEILKVPTTPEAPDVAVIGALRSLQDGERGTVAWLGHATTIATNALLGQVGLELPRVVSISTEGFRDLIEIGRQNRPRIYDLFVERPRPLVAREDRLTVRERLDAHGAVVEPLDDASLSRAIDAVRERRPGAVAICFLHAYANPDHERRVASALRERLGLEYVICSSDVNPEYREYERCSTTVVSAVLAPLIARYLGALGGELRKNGVTVPLHVMRSDGGLSLASVAASLPASLIESGPASGVIAAAFLARALGIERALSLDMGGTTAKAGAILGGAPQVVTEFEAAGETHGGRSVKGSGYPVRYPFLDLSEVSAGGGTIAWIDDARRLRVGPLSAGADPGPACYGRSERATVTDANVVLGRLNPTHLLGGTFPIDARRALAAVAVLGERIGLSAERTAAGIVALVDAQMAKALRIVTVERGLDPRAFTIVAFGGGAPLHACALAEDLRIDRIVVPLHPGLLSAQGLLVAELSAAHAHSVLREIADVEEEEVERIFEMLESWGRDALRAQGAEGIVRYRRSYDARYRGQSFELQIEHAASLREVERRFHELHRARYGYAVEEEAVEIVNVRSTATAARGRSRHPERSEHEVRRKSTGRRKTSRRLWLDGEFVGVRVFQRVALEPGVEIAGAAIIEQYDCTTYVAPGWNASVLGDGTLSLQCLRRSFESDRGVYPERGAQRRVK